MNPVAGWYADPVTPTIARYWDGASWTEHTAPLQSSLPEARTNVHTAVAAPPSVADDGYGRSDGGHAPANMFRPAYAPMQSPVPYPPAPPQPHYVVAVPRKNEKATRALIWGIIGLFINPLALPSLMAIVFGIQARSIADDMEHAGLPDSRRGRATAAIVVGSVGVALFLVLVVIYLNRR
jgi:hypothetical protein